MNRRRENNDRNMERQRPGREATELDHRFREAVIR